jgi:hypothetical protein
LRLYTTVSYPSHLPSDRNKSPHPHYPLLLLQFLITDLWFLCRFLRANKLICAKCSCLLQRHIRVSTVSIFICLLSGLRVRTSPAYKCFYIVFDILPVKASQCKSWEPFHKLPSLVLHLCSWYSLGLEHFLFSSLSICNR